MLGEVPHLVDFLQPITIIESLFLEFQGPLGARSESLWVTTGFLLQDVGTRTAQREHQLALRAVWKHRMVQEARW